MRFKKSHIEHTLFIENFNGKYTASNDDNEVDQVKDNLREVFKLRNLGPLRFFLRLEIAHSSKGIYISQHKYVLELLKET